MNIRGRVSGLIILVGILLLTWFSLRLVLPVLLLAVFMGMLATAGARQNEPVLEDHSDTLSPTLRE
jgi:hypothetical protein